MAQQYPRTINDITELYIHCSATPNGREHNAEDIDHWHGPDREARGLRPFRRTLPDVCTTFEPHLKHIGYHFVFLVGAFIHCGRDWREIGAHASGHNFNSLGLCLIGTDQFSVVQWRALRTHVKWLQSMYPNLKHIRGHNEVSSKICPGFDVQAWLEGDMKPLKDHLLPPSNPLCKSCLTES